MWQDIIKEDSPAPVFGPLVTELSKWLVAAENLPLKELTGWANENKQILNEDQELKNKLIDLAEGIEKHIDILSELLALLHRRVQNV